MSTHHEFAPSSMERLAGCPWSYHNCKDWSQPESADASHGTLLHLAMHDDSVFNKLNKSDKEIVQALKDEHVAPYAKLEHYHELKLEVWKSDGTLFNFGTADFIVISPDGLSASLKDWKFGNYEVTPAADNPQLKNYVVGIFQRFPKVQTVYAMTVQPAYGVAEYDNQAVFNRSQLPELLAELETIVEKAVNSHEGQANPNADNCRYCNKTKCSSFLRKMDENFSVMQIDSSLLTTQEHDMTIEFADKILCAEKEIKKIMETKVAVAKDLIIANGGSENFTLRNGKVSRTTDWNGLCEKHGICQEEIDSFTTEKQGEPYLASRMRKKVIAIK